MDRKWGTRLAVQSDLMKYSANSKDDTYVKGTHSGLVKYLVQMMAPLMAMKMVKVKVKKKDQWKE